MPFGMFFDPTMIWIIPALLLTLWAQARVHSAYARFSQVGTRHGLTGAQLARRIMQDSGIHEVEVNCIEGEMTDHYDPTKRVVNLSQGVYDGRSVAALGIAAHEVGHATQHATHYAPLKLRHFIYPVSALGSNLGWVLFFVGLILAFALQSPWGVLLAKLGVYFFGAAVVFTLVTLPVEFDASKRALRALTQGGYLDDEETAGARAVLNAAALTYVAAAAMALSQLLRMLIILGGMRDRD